MLLEEVSKKIKTCARHFLHGEGLPGSRRRGKIGRVTPLPAAQDIGDKGKRNRENSFVPKEKADQEKEAQIK